MSLVHELTRGFSAPSSRVTAAAHTAFRITGAKLARIEPGGELFAIVESAGAAGAVSLKISFLPASGEVLVTVVAECRMAFTVVDRGRAKRHAKEFLEAMERVLSAPAPPPVIVRGASPPTIAPVASDPMAVLDARYVRGEIDLDEYESEQARLLGGG